MAKVTAQNAFGDKLRTVLRNGLKIAGIKSRIKLEQVPGLNLHRVSVISAEFDRLTASERQDLVWRIISQTFRPEEQLRISMILTLTPNDLKTQ